ncbi:MAG: hypothetical protein FD133_371 [Erysipelotrichaceae bacterium]|nr:MAG: hypothetical protein FD133_371 [Erysipelotrichaceae bacterium]
MLIKDLFVKDIERAIQGVIKVDDIDRNDQVELEEYVVTHEIQRIMSTFFDNYSKSISRPTDNIGVWITGFFGSGKSHFMKMLAYLLENKEVNSKKTIDYFNDKINDPLLTANIKLASQHKVDVILFDIAKKSVQGDSLVDIFRRTFYDHLGYSSSYFGLAELERKLDKDHQFTPFKQIFKAETNSEWTQARKNIELLYDEVVSVLIKMGKSEDSAKSWFESAVGKNKISIEDFVSIIKEYIMSSNNRVIFMIDEMGQFIGDDLSLMLELQAIAEEFGTKCNGKAWVVVSSQIDMDSITNEMKKRDSFRVSFSKIQARFPTRLILSSANVDEVIKKRILDKKNEIKSGLIHEFEQYRIQLETNLKFDLGAEWKKFKDNNDFVESYPFVPYQFSLLQTVFNRMSELGLAGKHFSTGERNMLSGFKNAAEMHVSESVGILIPFHEFYSSITDAIDESISVAVNQVAQKSIEKNNPFLLDVFKTLVLIRGIKELPATLENITTLMLSRMDQSRIELKEKVADTLEYLVKEIVVYKEDGRYQFLTNEEQDINREIKKKNVDISSVTNLVGKIIFDEIIKTTKFPYCGNIFEFNRIIDGQSIGINNKEIGVRIISPYQKYSEDMVRADSIKTNDVYVLLDTNADYIDEFEMELKIQAYLAENSGRATSETVARIIEVKKAEKISRNKRGTALLKDTVKKSKFYIHGNELPSKVSDESKLFENAIKELIDRVFTKLKYIEVNYSEEEVKRVLNKRNEDQISITGETNQVAKNEIFDFIHSQSIGTYSTYSLKSIVDKFARIPYGWKDLDTRVFIAKLFMENKVELHIDGKSLLKGTQQVETHLINKTLFDKVTISVRDSVDPNIVQNVIKGMKEIFALSFDSNEDDNVFLQSKAALRREIEIIDSILVYYINTPEYPGIRVANLTKSIIAKLSNEDDKKKFFNDFCIVKENLKTTYNEFKDIREFFNSQQRVIFERSVSIKNKYFENQTHIGNSDLKQIVEEIKTIQNQSSPYSDISKLNTLNLAAEKILDSIFKEKIDLAKEALSIEEQAIKGIDLGKYIDGLSKEGTDLLYRGKEVVLKQLESARIKIDTVISLSAIEGEILSSKKAYGDFMHSISEIQKKYSSKTIVVTTKRIKISKIISQIEFKKIRSSDDIENLLDEVRRNLQKELAPNTELEIEE